MEYFIIDKEYMRKNVITFISIIKNVPNEYWSEDHFLEDLKGKWDYSIGIKRDNLLIAFIIASIKDDSIHIHKFMVRENYRSQGIGKILLDHFISITSNNFKSITLKVYKENQKAIEFYRANDFTINVEYEDLVGMIRRIS